MSLDAHSFNRVNGGVVLDFGAASARIHTDVEGLAATVSSVYCHFDSPVEPQLIDATVAVRRRGGLRRFVRPQIEFIADGDSPFEPFPADTHLPLLEWGLNHLLALRLSRHLLLHSGVVARGDSAIVMPALPGSGKSTLTAALTTRGYRLLSDEFGVVDLDAGALLPMVRPIALKNDSIEVLRNYSPDSILGPSFPKTRKGTVAHLAPDRPSFEARHVPARARLIVFPTYDAGADLTIETVSPSVAFAKLAVNSFNYMLLGSAAFRAVATLVSGCRCYRLHYRSLHDAVDALGTLLNEVEQPV